MSMLSRTEENDSFSLPIMCLITLYGSLVYLVSSLDKAGSPFIRSFKRQKSAPCHTPEKPYSKVGLSPQNSSRMNPPEAPVHFAAGRAAQLQTAHCCWVQPRPPNVFESHYVWRRNLMTWTCRYLRGLKL